MADEIPPADNAGKTIEQIGAEAAEKAKAEGALIDTEGKTIDDDLAGDGGDLVEDVRTETERLKAFIAEMSPKELLAHIEGGAKTLLKMIEAIPPGIAHGYHGLADEIRSRI